MLRRMAQAARGMQVITMGDALERLSYFRSRNVRQTPLYRGPLEIAGDGPEGFQIAVSVFTKTAEARAPTFKRIAAGDGGDGAVELVQRDFSYKRNDELGTEVDREDLVKAYKYDSVLFRSLSLICLMR